MRTVFRSIPPLAPRSSPETCLAVFPAPRPAGTVLMPITFPRGFFDGIGGALPDCSMGLLNRACDWLERHPETRDVPAHELAKFSSNVDLAVPPLLAARIAVRGKKGAIRLAEGCGITITFAGPAAAPSAPSAHRTALYRLPALKKELRARDGDQCRYCARRVRWGAGQAADSAVWDWLDPAGPASAGNIVTACKECSGVKAGRPPKDSGLVLLDPPPESRDASCDASEQGKPERDPSKRHRDASGGKTAGQKRHETDQDLYLDQSLKEDQSRSDARARDEAALVAEVADLACSEHGFMPDEDWVRAAIAAVDERIRTRKTRTRVRSRRGYVLQSAKDRRLWDGTRPAGPPAPAQDPQPTGGAEPGGNPWIPSERHKYEPGRGYQCRRCRRQKSNLVHEDVAGEAGAKAI